MIKVAKLARRNVRPTFAHDCPNCKFLGRLNGKDLYVCKSDHGVEYISRHGNREEQYGSLGGFTPPGSDYSFAAALLTRGEKVLGCEWKV